jgi:hypothetical protein
MRIMKAWFIPPIVVPIAIALLVAACAAIRTFS